MLIFLSLDKSIVDKYSEIPRKDTHILMKYQQQSTPGNIFMIFFAFMNKEYYTDFPIHLVHDNNNYTLHPNINVTGTS